MSRDQFPKCSQAPPIVDAGFKLRERDSLHLRMDTKYWLDDRASTGLRTPNPELQLWLSYEARL